MEFLYERYVQSNGFKNYKNQLRIQVCVESLKENQCFSFMVVFLGLIVFPKRDKYIDILLAGGGEGVDHNGNSCHYFHDFCRYCFVH